jgi:hypothetical protein
MRTDGRTKGYDEAILRTRRKMDKMDGLIKVEQNILHGAFPWVIQFANADMQVIPLFDDNASTAEVL